MWKWRRFDSSLSLKKEKRVVMRGMPHLDMTTIETGWSYGRHWLPGKRESGLFLPLVLFYWPFTCWLHGKVKTHWRKREEKKIDRQVAKGLAPWWAASYPLAPSYTRPNHSCTDGGGIVLRTQTSKDFEERWEGSFVPSRMRRDDNWRVGKTQMSD